MLSFAIRSGSVALTLLALSLAPFLASSVRAQATEAEVLSNTSVVNMITGKVAKDLILTKIRTTKTSFDVTVPALVRLHQNKVPQDVIRAMMTASADPKLAVAPSGPAEILTNTDVVQMVMGQLPRPVIIEKIRVTKAKYDVTSDGLVSLNTNKVPQDVVKAMMAAPAGPPK